MTERTARRIAHGLWLGTVGGWLAGMALALQDRLAAVGGTLAVRSTPGIGTTVAGRVPAHPQDGAP